MREGREVVLFLDCGEFPGLEFEGRRPVHLGVQAAKRVEQVVAGDATSAGLRIPLTVVEGRDGRPEFRGSYVAGRRGQRFVYLVWFVPGGELPGFRRAKVGLSHLNWADLAGDELRARLRLTDARGGPVCASLGEDVLQWCPSVDAGGSSRHLEA